MNVSYIYCPYCGYEDSDVEVQFSATYANGDFYICPKCNNETSQIERDPQEEKE